MYINWYCSLLAYIRLHSNIPSNDDLPMHNLVLFSPLTASGNTETAGAARSLCWKCFSFSLFFSLGAATIRIPIIMPRLLGVCVRLSSPPAVTPSLRLFKGGNITFLMQRFLCSPSSANARAVTGQGHRQVKDNDRSMALTISWHRQVQDNDRSRALITSGHRQAQDGND